VEEATETEYKSIKQLMKRQRGLTGGNIRKTLTLSFNPILQSNWIYKQYFGVINWADDQKEYQSERLTILKTTYKDNCFLTQDDIDDLENEDDKYYYDVYTLGKWGILGDVIFSKVFSRDLSRMRAQFTNHRAGLDFGFADDPAAMPVMHYDKMRKTIYLFEELYERGLTNDMLAVEIKKLIGAKPITCDSAEPKSIKELKDNGVKAHAAKKGKDSVNFGIQWLQQQTIIIDSKCINAKHEFTTYHWKKDKDGHAMKVPSEKDNHLIDAARYALEGDMTTTRARSAKVDLYGNNTKAPRKVPAYSDTEIDTMLQESNYE
jgi:phage terminase large subunit